jgi:acetyl-CoA carboxylase carboxyltransferase component
MSTRRWLTAPVHGAVAALGAVPGQVVPAGHTLLLQEAMKMEVPLHAPGPGRVHALAVAVGDVVEQGTPLVDWEDLQAAAASTAVAPGAAPDRVAEPPALRADLQALHGRLAQLQDSARPQAAAQRHAAGHLTARQVVAGLLDANSFSEYGALAVAAQRSRRSLGDLQAATPADGLITGSGTVHGLPVAVLVYDYTVLAGTQGVFNHQKADRLLALATRHHWPVLMWAEGGGGRPGDVDWLGVAGLDCTTFARLAALHGQVPLVGMASGHCFAGNAALLGCCDVVIATAGSSIGLGGPAMIEGGGLGVVAAADVGPVADLLTAGVVDVCVANDAAAVALARQLVVLLAKPAADAAPAAWQAPSAAQTQSLRQAVPANRQSIFDPLAIIHAVVDAGSAIQLRPGFGGSLVTVLATLAGQPVAIAASQPAHLGGALDAASCDKLVQFMQLAGHHGLPLITLVDTPGFMVGPASEKTGMVRHAGRLFVAAAKLRVPVLAVVLRRGFGLGAMALTAGHFHAPLATCAWPGAEFGAMGLEGAVRLGYRKELQAAPEHAREALFAQLLAQAQAKGQALNMASHLEIDEVIDPADTRNWLLRHLQAARLSRHP